MERMTEGCPKKRGTETAIEHRGRGVGGGLGGKGTPGLDVMAVPLRDSSFDRITEDIISPIIKVFFWKN